MLSLNSCFFWRVLNENCFLSKGKPRPRRSSSDSISLNWVVNSITFRDTFELSRNISSFTWLVMGIPSYYYGVYSWSFVYVKKRAPSRNWSISASLLQTTSSPVHLFTLMKSIFQPPTPFKFPISFTSSRLSTHSALSRFSLINLWVENKLKSKSLFVHWTSETGYSSAPREWISVASTVM